MFISLTTIFDISRDPYYNSTRASSRAGYDDYQRQQYDRYYGYYGGRGGYDYYEGRVKVQMMLMS